MTVIWFKFILMVSIKAFNIAVVLLFLKREEDREVDLKVIQHYIILSKGFTASGSKAISFVGNVMQSEIISNIQVQNNIPEIYICPSNCSGSKLGSDKGLIGCVK